MRPQVQLVTLETIDDMRVLLKLARFIPSDESRFEDDLLDDPRNRERGNVSVVCLRSAFCWNGPVLGGPEGRVCHQDHGLVGGGAVASHRYNLLRHLINVNLKLEEKMLL